jgi:hypothetical protein
MNALAKVAPREKPKTASVIWTILLVGLFARSSALPMNFCSS